jgi:hypothetical protein
LAEGHIHIRSGATVNMAFGKISHRHHEIPAALPQTTMNEAFGQNTSSAADLSGAA